MDTVEVAGAGASLVELAHMREGVYRMFSSLYFKELTDEQIRFFASEGLPMLEGVEGSVGQGARAARRALCRVTFATREDLAVDYAHTFLAAGSTKEEQRACPFESVFTSRTGLMMQEGRDQVYKTMFGGPCNSCASFCRVLCAYWALWKRGDGLRWGTRLPADYTRVGRFMKHLVGAVL